MLGKTSSSSSWGATTSEKFLPSQQVPCIWVREDYQLKITVCSFGELMVGTKLGLGKILQTAKDGKSLAEDNLNSQLHQCARESLHGRLLLFFLIPSIWQMTHQKNGKTVLSYL
jgi:hypothetical protein